MNTLLTGVPTYKKNKSFNIDQELYIKGKWKNNISYKNYFNKTITIENNKNPVKFSNDERLFVRGIPLNQNEKFAEDFLITKDKKEYFDNQNDMINCPLNRYRFNEKKKNEKLFSNSESIQAPSLMKKKKNINEDIENYYNSPFSGSTLINSPLKKSNNNPFLKELKEKLSEIKKKKLIIDTKIL